jgi:hypothetical protein
VFEKDRYYARIWVYLKSSGSAGRLGYYRVGPSSIAKSEFLEIYPGDGGSPLGNALYQAVLQRSPIPYRLERSHTDPQGRVTWQPY